MPHKTIEDRRAYHAEWRKRNQDKLKAWAILSRNNRTPEAHRAGEAVRRALKAGVLVRPEACEECAIECKPDAAHFDYERRLAVRWLCRVCHKRWDTIDPKENGYDATGAARLRAGTRNQDKTHCPKGHPYIEANTLRASNGGRRCAQCHRDRERGRKSRPA